MEEPKPDEPRCQICQKTAPEVDLIPGAIIRQAIVQEIQRTKSDWDSAGFICTNDLNLMRERYIESLLENENRDLTHLEKEVIASLKSNEILSSPGAIDFEGNLSLGDQVADRVASFGGSWRFIGFFTGFMIVWIVINSIQLFREPFDPYPFILLNLILSCIAAMQAPIIMMSQNRQETKDRFRAMQDYQINLKAELEIRHLHEKMDHLLMQQWSRLVEIQQIQLELLNELNRTKKSATDSIK
jgi:uncharacterized membrane protein